MPDRNQSHYRQTLSKRVLGSTPWPGSEDKVSRVWSTREKDGNILLYHNIRVGPEDEQRYDRIYETPPTWNLGEVMRGMIVLEDEEDVSHYVHQTE